MIQTLDPEIMSASWQTLYNQLYQKSDSIAAFYRYLYRNQPEDLKLYQINNATELENFLDEY